MNFKKPHLILFIVLIFTAITYSNHFNNGFHFDDSHAVESNVYIRDLSNIPRFFKDGTTFSSLPANQSYRPIVTTSLAIDYWLGNGYNLFYFHLSTFVLFLIQGVLMYFFFRKVLNLAWQTQWNEYIALAAVAWYLLHPANAETINYVIARSDSISTLFVVLAFVMYIYSNVSRKYHLYLIPVGIGALAKPPAVMFAPMLLFYVAFFEKDLSIHDFFSKNSLSKIIETIKEVIPSFVFSAFMFLFIQKMEPETWDPGGFSKFNYLITQPFVMVYYVVTFFLPVSLSADTDWTPLQSISDMRFWVGMMLVIGMIFTAIVFSKDKRLRPVSFGIIWFFLALLPTSSIVPLAEVMNDHRLFFPYVGMVISVTWVIALLLYKSKEKIIANHVYRYSLLAIIFILLGTYAYGTYQRNKVWKTEESLWLDVTIKSPKNGRGMMNYGLTQMQKGNYETALKYFIKAQELTPYYSYVFINKAICLNAMGKDKAEVERNFKYAIELNPNHYNGYYFYGDWLLNSGRTKEAAENLAIAVQKSPNFIDARHRLMTAYAMLEDFTNLKILAEQTLAMVPNDPIALKYINLDKGEIEIKDETYYINKGLALYNSGNFEEAIKTWQEVLKLNPNNAIAYNNIGSAYNLMKKWDEAIPYFNKALALNPDFQLAKNNLEVAINGKKAN
ncbi:MAG: tetratricopeptide repeat protein [Bacteroidia bacterium]